MRGRECNLRVVGRGGGCEYYASYAALSRRTPYNGASGRRGGEHRGQRGRKTCQTGVTHVGNVKGGIERRYRKGYSMAALYKMWEGDVTGAYEGDGGEWSGEKAHFALGGGLAGKGWVTTPY